MEGVSSGAGAGQIFGQYGPGVVGRRACAGRDDERQVGCVRTIQIALIRPRGSDTYSGRRSPRDALRDRAAGSSWIPARSNGKPSRIRIPIPRPRCRSARVRRDRHAHERRPRRRRHDVVHLRDSDCGAANPATAQPDASRDPWQRPRELRPARVLGSERLTFQLRRSSSPSQRARSVACRCPSLVRQRWST
jgi:hypothetical protein